MNRLKMHRDFPILLSAVMFIVLAIVLMMDASIARALPEYSSPARTGEPCATCHVSAGGGGPRTLRGMLWTNAGRPNEVPILEGILLAPGVDDPQVLYDAACAGCHGFQGEGLSAVSLVEVGFSLGMIRRLIEIGRPDQGMPAFSEQLTDEQLNLLVDYVAALNAGLITPTESDPLLIPPMLRDYDDFVFPIVYRGN